MVGPSHIVIPEAVLTERKRTKVQERSYSELMDSLEEQRSWLRQFKLKNELIPADWARIEKEHPTKGKRIKVTADLDADTVRWFRNFGTGYQARMNAVLRSYMLAVVSKEIESRGDRDWKGDPL